VNGVTLSEHNLYVVTVDEIRHCLGLTHSKVSKSVMYPTYNHKLSKIPKQDFLSDEDIQRIQQAYGKPRAKNIEINGLQIKIRPVEHNKIKLIIGQT